MLSKWIKFSSKLQKSIKPKRLLPTDPLDKFSTSTIIGGLKEVFGGTEL